MARWADGHATWSWQRVGVGNAKCYNATVLQYNCSDVAGRYVSELEHGKVWPRFICWNWVPNADAGSGSEIRIHRRIVRLCEIWVWILGI